MDSFTGLRKEYETIGAAIMEVSPSEVGAHIPDVILRLSNILERFNKLCATINVCYVCKQPLDKDYSVMQDGTKVCSQHVSVPA